ncbi:MAG: efflux RND transporter periplasmic adaptor subunit [Phycisphaerae bacterium]
MRLRVVLPTLLGITVAGGAGYYAFESFRRSAMPPAVGRPPNLDQAPLRLYGLLEPRGREVFVGPPVAKRVIAVLAKEGMSVVSGQVLVQLDAEVEQQALRVAQAAVEEARARVALAQDEFDRVTQLVPASAVSKTELSRATLTLEREKRAVETALAVVESRRVEADQLTLRAPIDGRVYKLDVRVGELLTPQDASRIVLGPREKQVRLFVEVFWLSRVRPGDRFTVRDAESLALIGEGRVAEVLPYVGPRDFRTEDRLERLDTKYGQAILLLEADCDSSIGLLVLCERAFADTASR